jgi:hypothetical protein
LHGNLTFSESWIDVAEHEIIKQCILNNKWINSSSKIYYSHYIVDENNLELLVIAKEYQEIYYDIKTLSFV